VRLALLGDIHGNAAALRAVLESASAERVDALLVTGDLVGYYFDAQGVLDLLARWRKYMVRGNHEDMLAAARAGLGALPSIERKYGSGVRVALETLSGEAVEALCSLPHPLEIDADGTRILLCHGTPWDNDVYVYPDADETLLARCAVPGYEFVILGHTHYPMVRSVNGITIVNPGSVGQPRNRQPGAHWALLDTGTGETALRCEPYDIASVAAEARRRQPELPYLAEVLERR
jgi:putative phosphoesterase